MTGNLFIVSAPSGAGKSSLVKALLETFTRISSETMNAFRHALRGSDWVSLGQEAHKFKSSARTIGAERLGDLCEVLEQHCAARNESQAAAAVEEVSDELQLVMREVTDRLQQQCAAVA